MRCEFCERPDSQGKPHECVPRGYVELPRTTDEDIAIEAEARRLGIHPFVLVRQRHAEQKERERIAAEARLHALCAEWGMTP